jgi:hypothetical protein
MPVNIVEASSGDSFVVDYLTGITMENFIDVTHEFAGADFFMAGMSADAPLTTVN